MLQKTEGIVIHTIPYSDTSLIAKVFTADYGLIAFMIKGTRGKKTSNKAVLYQPLTMLALDIYYQENKNLQTIKETKLLLNPAGIYGHMLKTSMVLFIAELLQKVLKDHYTNIGLFMLLKQRIEELNSKPFDPDFHLNFMLDMALELGFLPFDNYSINENLFSIQEGKFVGSHPDHTGAYFMGEEDSKHLHLLMARENFTMHRNQRRSLLAEFIKYFQFHNPGMSSIRSVAVLQEVL